MSTNESNDATFTPPPAPETEEFTYRKLIRPSLVRNDQQPRHDAPRQDGLREELRSQSGIDYSREQRPRIEQPRNHGVRFDGNGNGVAPAHDGRRNGRGERFTPGESAERFTHQKRSRGDRAGGRKTPPAEQTHAEGFYYQKQMQAKTVMVLVMQDGEELEGIIEWYDKNCIKMNRIDEPNLVIYKSNIKYMFKAADEEAN